MKLAMSTVIFAALIVGAGCDPVVTDSEECTAEIVGAWPGAALVGDLPENPHLNPWVALKGTRGCTEANLASLHVQLFAINDGLAHGFANLVSFKDGCAVYEWPETKIGFGTSDEFAIVASPPIAGAASLFSSFEVPDFEPQSVLPMWKTNGDWSLFLIHPLQTPGCTPLGL